MTQSVQSDEYIILPLFAGTGMLFLYADGFDSNFEKEGVSISVFHSFLNTVFSKINRIKGYRPACRSMTVFAVVLTLVLTTVSCSSSDNQHAAYQTLAAAIKDNIAQLIPTAVPQEGEFHVSEDTPVNEIGSKQDLFFVLQDSLYNFDPDVYIKIEDYDLFSQFWSELSADGALHSTFETREVQIEYDDNSPCTMRLVFTYNAAGQILKKNAAKEVMEFSDASVTALYNKCIAILAEITNFDMSELQRETAIHDYIVTHTQYSISGDQDVLASAESVLMGGQGQCQGYSEAMSLLLGLSGITSRVVSGTAFGNDGEAVAHAWNQVFINGVWYHVDVTWDDPIPDTGDYATHMYMNRSDDFMKLDHIWSDLFQICPIDFPVTDSDSAVNIAAS